MNQLEFNFEEENTPEVTYKYFTLWLSDFPSHSNQNPCREVYLPETYTLNYNPSAIFSGTLLKT